MFGNSSVFLPLPFAGAGRLKLHPSDIQNRFFVDDIAGRAGDRLQCFDQRDAGTEHR